MSEKVLEQRIAEFRERDQPPPSGPIGLLVH